MNPYLRYAFAIAIGLGIGLLLDSIGDASMTSFLLDITPAVLLAAVWIWLEWPRVSGWLARVSWTRLTRRFLPALVLGIALATTPVAHAQIPVIDALALVEKVTNTVLQATITGIRLIQAQRIYKMSLRISEWISLHKYFLDAEFMPEWRIHNWFTDDVLFAKDYHWALTYGDPTGAGFASVTVPRRDPSAAFAAGYTPEATAVLRSYLAQLDALDSTLVTGTDVAGEYRFGGRAEAEAIIAYQDMILTDDPNSALATALDQIAAAELVTLQNKQARAAMDRALLEQLLVEQILDREADAEAHNARLAGLTVPGGDGEGGGPPSVVAGADAALQNWRLR